MGRVVLFGLAAFMLSFISCSDAENGTERNGTENSNLSEDDFSAKFVIKGQVKKDLLEGDTARKVVLSVQNTNTTSTQPVFSEVASAVLDDEYKFTLTGEYTGYQVARISIAGFEEVMIVEQGTTNITVSQKGGDYEYSFEGAIETAKFHEIKDHIEGFTKTVQELQKKYMPEGGGQPTQDQMLSFQQELQPIQSSFEEFLRMKIDSISPSYAAFVALSFMNPNTNQDFYFEQADKYAANINEHSYAKAFVDEAIQAKEMMQKLAVGDVAPDFTLKTPKGKELSLANFKGKYILLDFWASWCGPCRMENPNVVAAYNKYSKADFDILSVSLDKDQSAWEQAIKKDGLVWENHVSDLGHWESAVVPLYKLDAIPKTMLLDKEGVIVAIDLRGAALEAKLEEIFGF